MYPSNLGKFDWTRGGDENPLAPFSRGKFVWTTGETRVLAETMINAKKRNREKKNISTPIGVPTPQVEKKLVAEYTDESKHYSV
jgi:hypothetical protein